MNFQLFSLIPRDRKQKDHQELTPTVNSSLMSKPVVAVLKQETIKITHPRPPTNIRAPPRAPPRNFPNVLPTIMEDEPSEYMNAPCVTIRKSTTNEYQAKREPFFPPKSHQRIVSAESNSATSKKRRHRRSAAMTEDEFAGIILLCDARGS